MVRPLNYYAIFDMGEVIAIRKGAAAARLLSPHRAYKSFTTELAAEEYAAWWNFRQAPTPKKVATAVTTQISSIARMTSDTTARTPFSFPRRHLA